MFLDAERADSQHIISKPGDPDFDDPATAGDVAAVIETIKDRRAANEVRTLASLDRQLRQLDRSITVMQCTVNNHIEHYGEYIRKKEGIFKFTYAICSKLANIDKRFASNKSLEGFDPIAQ